MFSSCFGRFIGIPAAARQTRFLHVLEGSSEYPGLLRSIRSCYFEGLEGSWGKVFRNTRSCYARLRFLHVLEGSSAYPGRLRSIRFLDILKVWKVRGQRFFGIPAAAMLGFVFFMFWKVPRNTRGCSIAFVFLIF